AGFVPEHDAAVNHRTGSPNRAVRFVLPDHFAFVRAQAVHVVIARVDVNAIVDDDRTGPDADVFAGDIEMSAFGNEIPNPLAGVGFVAADDAIFRRGVNVSADDGRRRV